MSAFVTIEILDLIYSLKHLQMFYDHAKTIIKLIWQ